MDQIEVRLIQKGWTEIRVLEVLAQQIRKLHVSLKNKKLESKSQMNGKKKR